MRNWTTGEMSVKAVSPQTSRNVVMIETIAIKIGTKARSDAKTKARTISAPTPPSTDSSSTPVPLSLPLAFWSASNPVTWTGAPATVV